MNKDFGAFMNVFVEGGDISSSVFLTHMVQIIQQTNLKVQDMTKYLKLVQKKALQNLKKM